MILALTALLNSILSYFNIDLYILSYIGGISIFTMVFLYLSSYVFKFCEYHRMFFITLYKSWFGDNVDCKIIESAIVFWFMDDNYQYEKKVEKFYMN